MRKFVYLFFLFLVLKSVVSEDVKSELKSTAQTSNSSDQTFDEIDSIINSWRTRLNPEFRIYSEDDKQENDITIPDVQTIKMYYLNDPRIVSVLLAPEKTLSPSKRKLVHGILAKLGMNRFTLRFLLNIRDRIFPSDSFGGFRGHIIRKRDMREIEKDILHSTDLFNRKQKRSIIPDTMFYYFSSFLFSESQNGITAEPTTSKITTDKLTDPKPITDEATEPEPTSNGQTNFGQITLESSTPVPSTVEPSTPEPITLKSLQDRLEKILPPQLNDYPTVEDQINNLVAIEDEQLKNNIRNAIKTDDSDEHTIMYNIDIPEMKSDAIYVQRLSGSAADNMAAFLKQFETNDSQNFDFKLLEPEIITGEDEKEEKPDDYPVNDEEEEREEEEEDDA